MSSVPVGIFEYDVSIYRRPPDIAASGLVRVAGMELERLDATSLGRENLFDVSFDEVLASLAELPQMDVEPDGFFTHSGASGVRIWRLNGHLYELNDRLWRLDLRGDSPSDAFDAILTTTGWPKTPVVFQLCRLGVTIAESDFRRWVPAAYATDSLHRSSALEPR